MGQRRPARLPEEAPTTPASAIQNGVVSDKDPEVRTHSYAKTLVIPQIPPLIAKALDRRQSPTLFATRAH